MLISKNLKFWHWYPRLICEGLTEEQLHWQPDMNPNHITFAIWHAYRSEDELIHMLLMQQPSVFARDGWAERLPVAEPGDPPFGTGLNRDQIARVHLPIETLYDYADAVGAAVIEYAESLTPEQEREEIPLPFFKDVYGFDSACRAEVLTFFSVGHVTEHLGEVQYIKGLMGLQGAPL